ncbi:uncharacterized protein PG986_004968 [Apiospora aurea]|uniref:Ricin B lectin domain-containing protein n=1 Tax=Apiospora aurea TaxID=335848 RepID=A0ABR1QG79_9PEZI
MSVLRPSNRTPTFPFRLKLLLFLVLLLGVFIHRYTRQAPSDQSEPWPGNTYLIIEQASGRPIVRNKDGGIALGNPSETSTNPAHSRWQCVEANNHFGFQNPQSGRYLGHDGGDRTQATAWELNEWEYIMWRPHPKGGFQLLSPFWMHSLKLYIVSEDGNGLVRRMHGTTLFEFKKL